MCDNQKIQKALKKKKKLNQFRNKYIKDGLPQKVWCSKAHPQSVIFEKFSAMLEIAD